MLFLILKTSILVSFFRQSAFSKTLLKNSPQIGDKSDEISCLKAFILFSYSSLFVQPLIKDEKVTLYLVSDNFSEKLSRKRTLTLS